MTEKKKEGVPNPQLKKALRLPHVWAIGVGMVISGEYFGWNYGWGAAGTIGFLIATLLVTVMYLTLVFSFSELTTAIPNAGGPFIFAFRAFGPMGGLIAGYATVVEFVLAPPAIAFAIGAYVNFLLPAVPIIATAVGCYLLFTLINFFGIKESAVFTLIITMLAITELLLFMGITAPHFKLSNFLHNPIPFGWSGVIASLPFAIWLYLGIEGLAMTAEEVIQPNKTIPKGYLFSVLTLVSLAFGVMLFSGGIGDWQSISNIDYPLPESIAMVLGKTNRWTGFFTAIGLFGLIASFHSLIIGYSRQIFALSRSGFLPPSLSTVNRRFQTPHRALISGSVIGIIALYSGTTDKIIILSVLGAVVMYCISLVSLFKLRRRSDYQPAYSTPAYPWFPIAALLLAGVCLATIVYFNVLLSALFFLGLLLLIIFFKISGKAKADFTEGTEGPLKEPINTPVHV